MKISDIENIINDLENHSSPGFPLTRFVTNNADLKQNVNQSRTILIVLVCCLIHDLLFVDLGTALDNMFPTKLFIKNEPHKLKKITQGRLRLISSVGVQIQILERLLYTDQDDAFKIGPSPTLSGWGMTTDEQQQHFYDTWTSKPGWWYSWVDFNYFDWSEAFGHFLLTEMVRLKRRRGFNKPDTHYHQICLKLTFLIHSTPFLIGQNVIQVFLTAIRRSGGLRTSTDNSHVSATALFAGLTWDGFQPLIAEPWFAQSTWQQLFERGYQTLPSMYIDVGAAGDDAVIRTAFEPRDPTLYLQKIGLSLKEFKTTHEYPPQFELCSRWWRDGRAWVLDTGKVLRKFFHHKVLTPELIHQLLYEIRSEPQLVVAVLKYLRVEEQGKIIMQT